MPTPYMGRGIQLPKDDKAAYYSVTYRLYYSRRVPGRYSKQLVKSFLIYLILGG